MKLARIAATAAALTLTLAAQAQAATPGTIGTGRDPEIAVTPDGKAHIAWTTEGAGGVDSLSYCRVAKGAATCEKSLSLAWPNPSGDLNSRPGSVSVHVNSNLDITIFAGCWSCGSGEGITERMFRFASTNGGESFPSVTERGSTSASREPHGRGAYNFSTGIFVGATQSRVQAFSGTETDGVQVSSLGTSAEPTVGRVPGFADHVYAVSDLDRIRLASFNDPTPGSTTSAELQAPGNWAGDKALPDPADETEPRFATISAGPQAGLYLGSDAFVPNDNRLLVRKYDPATDSFSTAKSAEGSDPIDNNSLAYIDLRGDDGGRLHAVWRTLHDGNRLRYAVSSDGGATWSVAATLAKQEAFFGNRVAAGPDGQGFVVWHGNGETPVRVVPIDPQAESTPPPSTTPPATTPPTTTPLTPAPFTGPTTNASTSFGNTQFTLNAPKTCLQPGQSYKVKLSVKRKKKKGKKVVKVSQVVFSIDGKTAKTDKKAPFVQTLTVKTTAAKGSTILLRARATIKVKRGKKAPKKSVKVTLRVCA